VWLFRGLRLLLQIRTPQPNKHINGENLPYYPFVIKVIKFISESAQLKQVLCMYSPFRSYGPYGTTSCLTENVRPDGGRGEIEGLTEAWII
jgi:hypothetical protein